MKESYNYPIDPYWTKKELMIVIEMWNLVEAVYEKGSNPQAFLAHYRRFKEVVPSIGEEKKLDKEFKEVSGGYSLYQAKKACLAAEKEGDACVRLEER